MLRLVSLLLCTLLAAACPLTAETWRVRFQLDENKRTIRLVDMAFPAAENGVAVGVLSEGSREKFVSLVSSNGGKQWSMVDIDDVGQMSFLTRNLGYMAGTKGIWRTLDSGQHWERISRLKNILQVSFVDERVGFAVGANKQIYTTNDGGRRWVKHPALDKIELKPERVTLRTVTFVSATEGLILGSYSPATYRGMVEEALEPTFQRTARPGTLISLETFDAGKTWNVQQASVFGYPAQVLDLAGKTGLLLLRFEERFRLASIVYAFEWGTRKFSTVFESEEWIVTDFATATDGTVYLAAVQRTGLSNIPLYPAKIRIFASQDLKNWRTLDPDYRIQGTEVKLATTPTGAVWLMADQAISELVP